MANQTLIIKWRVSFAWWVKPYLFAMIILAKLYWPVDFDRVAKRAANGILVAVNT